MRYGYAAVMMLVLIAGCRQVEPLDARYVTPPRLNVQGVEIVEAGPGGVRLLIRIEAVNGSDEQIPLIDARYRVSVDGGGRYTFESTVHRTLPPRSSSVFTLPAAVPLTSAAAARCEVRGSVVYNPPGGLRRLLTESSVPLPSSALSYEGALVARPVLPAGP